MLRFNFNCGTYCGKNHKQTDYYLLMVKRSENFVRNENTKYNWEQSEVSSWYVNKKGRVIANFPGSTSDYWRLTKRFEDIHYERK